MLTPLGYEPVSMREAGINIDIAEDGTTFSENAHIKAKTIYDMTHTPVLADDSGLSAWAKPYISAAAANGLVSGYATASGVSEIRGEKTITVAEAGVVLDHLLDGTLSGVQYAWSMSDHSPQDWAQPAMSRLERVSVLTSAQVHNPETPLDRRTACEMLYRALILLDS